MTSSLASLVTHAKKKRAFRLFAMSPDAIRTTDDRWSFPWWLFGILVSSPASVLVGFVLAVLLVWQRKRLQLWAWQVRARFR